MKKIAIFVLFISLPLSSQAVELNTREEIEANRRERQYEELREQENRCIRRWGNYPETSVPFGEEHECTVLLRSARGSEAMCVIVLARAEDESSPTAREERCRDILHRARLEEITCTHAENFDDINLSEERCSDLLDLRTRLDVDVEYWRQDYQPEAESPDETEREAGFYPLVGLASTGLRVDYAEYFGSVNTVLLGVTGFGLSPRYAARLSLGIQFVLNELADSDDWGGSLVPMPFVRISQWPTSGDGSFLELEARSYLLHDQVRMIMYTSLGYCFESGPCVSPTFGGGNLSQHTGFLGVGATIGHVDVESPFEVYGRFLMGGDVPSSDFIIPRFAMAGEINIRATVW